jgi:hypothetical protein
MSSDWLPMDQCTGASWSDREAAIQSDLLVARQVTETLPTVIGRNANGRPGRRIDTGRLRIRVIPWNMSALPPEQ